MAFLCFICRNRRATQGHSKDYNHNNWKGGNKAWLCMPCHTALHQINKKNSIDWDHLIPLLKQDILRKGDSIAEKQIRKLSKRAGTASQRSLLVPVNKLNKTEDKNGNRKSPTKRKD